MGANEKVTDQGGTAIASFRDPQISSGHFLIKLAGLLNPEVIDEELVTAGTSDADQLLNARYAISIARMMGCCVFCLPEDIVEVKPKMILTFVAAVMAVVLQRGGTLEENVAEN